jgi:hypothetical protein
MPFLPNSSLYLKKLSSEYQPYACDNFFRKSSILKEIAILGQPPSLSGLLADIGENTTVNVEDMSVDEI